MRVRHSESIPTSLNLVSLASWIWEPSPLYISQKISGRSFWNQEALTHHELILKSASLRLWICSLTPCRLNLSWWHIWGSQHHELQSGSFRLCNRVRIPVGVAEFCGRRLRAPFDWSSIWTYRQGNPRWTRQDKAVVNCWCNPETWPVHLSTRSA